MKILVIHQYYRAAGQAGGSRFNEFARFWQREGHEVSVIAGDLNYASGDVAPGMRRGRAMTRLVEEGVDVIRCRVPRSYHRGYVGRAAAFAGFMLMSCAAAIRAGRPDVIVATSPPLFTAITGRFASLLWRRPWVFEVRDLWPESAITTHVIARDGFVARLLFALERRACRNASLVTVLTPAFASDIAARGLAPRARIVLVPNGADAAFAPGPRDNAIRRELGWGDRFVAVYAGAHGKANAVHQLVDAAERLADRRDILIASVGDGPARADAEQLARSRGLSNIVFLGPRAKEDMPRILQAANAGIAVLQDNPTFRTVYPNKVFDYMACALPVVLGIDGVSRELVCDEAGAGLFAAPEDGAALAACISRLADDGALAGRLGESGRAWVSANATRERHAATYLRALEALVPRRTRIDPMLERDHNV